MIKIREAVEKDSVIIYDCICGLAEHVNQRDMVSATEQDIKESIFSLDSHVKVFVAENEENKKEQNVLWSDIKSIEYKLNKFKVIRTDDSTLNNDFSNLEYALVQEIKKSVQGIANEKLIEVN